MASAGANTRQEGEVMTGSVLLKDVISIPERAGTEDYVLKLTEGVGQGRLDGTIDDYVVTDDLVNSFQDALDLVAASLKDGGSRASFLSGSFGSGKSHFMAVLYALLGHNPTARAKAELAPVIAAHDGDLQGQPHESPRGEGVVHFAGGRRRQSGSSKAQPEPSGYGDNPKHKGRQQGQRQQDEHQARHTGGEGQLPTDQLEQAAVQDGIAEHNHQDGKGVEQ